MQDEGIADEENPCPPIAEDTPGDDEHTTLKAVQALIRTGNLLKTDVLKPVQQYIRKILTLPLKAWNGFIASSYLSLY
jgi:hypothetical protein